MVLYKIRITNKGDPNSFADGPFGSNLKKEHYTLNKEVRIIQLSNIGELSWKNENVKYTSFLHAKTIERSMVKPGDIVIAKMMPAGRAIIVPNVSNAYILSSDCVKLRAHDSFDKQFIVYSINSSSIRNQVYSEVQGTTRIRTSINKLKRYLIAIPPLNEQLRISNQIKHYYKMLDEI